MRLFSICPSLCDLSQHNALRGLSLLSQMTGFPFFLTLFWPCHMAGRILVLQPGIEARPQEWQGWTVSTGPPENSHGRPSFLWPNNTPRHINMCVCVCVCIPHFNPLVCWWAQVVSVCYESCWVSMRVQISSQGDDFVSVGQIPRSGIAGS